MMIKRPEDLGIKKLLLYLDPVRFYRRAFNRTVEQYNEITIGQLEEMIQFYEKTFRGKLAVQVLPPSAGRYDASKWMLYEKKDSDPTP